MPGLEHNSPIGAVVIGRNEGERLKRCMASIRHSGIPIVYVDSGSEDDSVNFCKESGIHVAELDLSSPFTAARARNLGAISLIQLHPSINYIQFIDGDCEIAEQWLANAYQFLRQNSEYAAVCGRRREVNPDASIFNALCDIEWDTKTGNVLACGGDVLMQANALQSVGGYDDALIAGEEPELCYRLREEGWKIFRLDIDMTYHDAKILSWKQWWNRTKRAGYAYTGGFLKHGYDQEHFNLRPVCRIIFWAFILPVAILLLSVFYTAFLTLFFIYPFQYFRLVLTGSREPYINRRWAFFNIAGKFAEFTGLIQCVKDNIFKQKANLIEYK